MALMGYPFIFDDIPSEFYGCSIAFLDEDANKRNSGSGKTFTTITPLRSGKQILINSTQD